ncbi:hypothetical protein LCGC14_2592520 [marine sediment metagenome]|uniref:Uncharacterized protein n=1 Tax=marine sediment metagenome TaxID=412755 RepID=A0A0F9D3X3_9ZZZZ
MTADTNDLYVECFNEVKRQFPGSSPHVMKEMSIRLFEEARLDKSRCPMGTDEWELRRQEFVTALHTIPKMRGIRPGDRRLDNAE